MLSKLQQAKISSKNGRFSCLFNHSRSDKKEQTLRELDLFVLDNSLRESTVGQMKGHTVPEKHKILREVKQCGFHDIVLSALSNHHRVDDAFVEDFTESMDESDNTRNYYAFSEVSAFSEASGKEIHWQQPSGVEKMRKYRLKNPIFEIDLAKEPENELLTQQICERLTKRIKLTYHVLSFDSKIFVNLRDMPYAMKRCPNRVCEIVERLGNMPPEKRPRGIMYEEPSGEFLPEKMGEWTTALRSVMDECNWKDGLLLFHVHKKWGLAEAVQLECLASGANGIWASVCEEGAANGHASSILTIMNLIKLGNKKVLKKYNCHYLRQAAINITKLTTGNMPHPRQAIYGERSLDLVFKFKGIAGGRLSEGEFDIAKFFGIEHPIRINELSADEDIVKKLVATFGADEQFTLDMARKMKEQIVIDLEKEVKCKEEYTSTEGLALLFERAGGNPTGKIAEAIEKAKPRFEYQKELLSQVYHKWQSCGPKGENESLDYSAFYHNFMDKYFGRFDCEDTKSAFKALDMYADHQIQFREFCVYMKWALREYPEDTVTAEELLDVTFQKGIIPAMHHETVKK